MLRSMKALMWTALVGLAALSSTASAADSGSRPVDAVVARYFGDWARADAASAVEPPAPASEPAPPPDRPVQDQHSPVTHMHITRMAYLLYASRYDGGELSRYIGDARDEEPDSDKEDTVVEGAYDEDTPFKNPWGQAISEMRHFWDCRRGPFKGLAFYDSAVDRAQKYFTGGYGLDGRYDGGWSGDPGKRRGAKGLGAVGRYLKGDKAKAFWYLGHAAHLLEDLTVPAHTLLWPHPYSGADAYETYTKTHYRQWSQVPSGPVDSFDTLYDLYFHTADVTNDFDAGSGSGPFKGRDGKKDRGSRRALGFTPEQLHEEGDVLMPLAYRRVASLYLFFFKQVDKTPPRVALLFPRSGDANAPETTAASFVTLGARAVDDESGVDRTGYRFETSRMTGSALGPWTSVSAAPTSSRVVFVVEPGQAYAVRVSAVDAAGNRAVSAAGYLTAEPSGPAVASSR